MAMDAVEIRIDFEASEAIVNQIVLSTKDSLADRQVWVHATEVALQTGLALEEL